MPTSSRDKPAIVVDKVAKRYRMSAGQDSLRDVISSLGSRLLHSNGSRETRDQDHLLALDDVSFEVQRGEALGIIGPNGAGKTTILKLLSRITDPTIGSIETHGRVSSLIELGAGFHPDLTGRENVYLNGVILGLTRKEVRERFDRIVEFAELGRFIDMQVKRYSSGMYARLGFSVAAHVTPEILLVDEVLAVGDASFQQKCYDFIHSFVKGGNTTIFISHNLYVVEQLCTRVIWLDHGRIMASGAPGQVLSSYLDSIDQKALTSNTAYHSENRGLQIAHVGFADASGEHRNTFAAGEDVVVEVGYRANHSIDRPYFCLAISDSQGGGPLTLASMLIDGNAPSTVEGEGTISCTFRAVPLMPRTYHVWGEVWAADRAGMLVRWQRMGTFRIVDGMEDQYQERGSGAITHTRADAPIRVQYEWNVKSKS